jgi:hypothetical protein
LAPRRPSRRSVSAAEAQRWLSPNLGTTRTRSAALARAWLRYVRGR